VATAAICFWISARSAAFRSTYAARPDATARFDGTYATQLSADSVPGAIEAVRPGWHLIGYSVPVGRRTPYFGFVAPEPIHVHLGFEYGMLIDDPDGELRGTDLRQVRFLTFRHPDEVRERQIGRYIRDAARLAAMSRAERLALTLDRDDLVLARREA